MLCHLKKLPIKQGLKTDILCIDIRKGNGWQRQSILYTIFGSVILNKPETNIAQLAMVIMRINEIEFMSIITIQVGQCLIPVCSTEGKT